MAARALFQQQKMSSKWAAKVQLMTKMNSLRRVDQKTYAICRIHINSCEKRVVQSWYHIFVPAKLVIFSKIWWNRSNSSMKWVLRNHWHTWRSVHHGRPCTGTNNDRRKVSMGRRKVLWREAAFWQATKQRVSKSQLPTLKKERLILRLCCHTRGTLPLPECLVACFLESLTIGCWCGADCRPEISEFQDCLFIEVFWCSQKFYVLISSEIMSGVCIPIFSTFWHSLVEKHRFELKQAILHSNTEIHLWPCSRPKSDFSRRDQNFSFANSD